MTITKFNSALPCGRRRYFAIGAHYADAARQIRARGLDAALEVAGTLGGAAQRVGIARSLVEAVEKAGEVPAYRIVRLANGYMVEVPNLSWRWKGRGKRSRQVGVVEWVPMFGHSGEPVRPLP